MAKVNNDTNRLILITALSMSITFGLLDIYIGLKSGGMKNLRIPWVIIPLAVTTGFYFIAYITSWYLVVSRLVRRLRLNIENSAIANGFLIGIAIILISMYFDVLAVRGSIYKIVGILFILTVSTIVSILIYLILTKVIEIKRPAVTGMKASLIIPIVLLEALFFIIIQKFVATPAVIFYGTYLVLVLATIYAISYINAEKLRVLSLLTAIVLLIVIGGPLAVILNQQIYNSTPTSEIKTNLNSSKSSIKHVILITVDTLRTDVLSSYGSQNVQTPNIDSLSADGVLFKNAYSSAPWTLPAFSSIMTGLPPGTHLTTKPSSKLPDKFNTIAEYMKGSGYYTGAIVRNIFLSPNYNLDQGFADYYHYPNHNRYVKSFGTALMLSALNKKLLEDVSTEDITNSAINWLGKHRDENFFYWIHYFDPHQPYAPPQRYITDRSEPPSRIGRKFDGAGRIRGGHFTATAREKQWIKELYDAEVRYVDENLGRLFKYLKESGLYEDSLIIFTSDHGEEFWDHGGFEHGHALYNEVIQVPLIIKMPGVNQSREENMRVSTQSLKRTILDAIGIEYDSDRLISGSLYPLIREDGTEISQEPLVTTGLLYYEDKESIINGDRKFIRSLVSNKEELYDLITDPHEQNELSSGGGSALEARQMLKEYNEKAKSLGSEYGVQSAEEVVLSKEKKEELKALDYIQ